MLGLGPIGGAPIGGSGATTVLPFSTIHYALTYQSVAFRAAQIWAQGSYGLTLQGVTFRTAMPVAKTAYALSYNAFGLQVQLHVASVSYALTYSPVLFDPSEPFATIHYALTLGDIEHSLDFNLGSVGSSISGGTFTRKQWRDILDEEERERAAAARKIADEKLRKRAEERRQRLADAEARRAAREEAAAHGAAVLDALTLAHHEAAARGMEHLRTIASQAGAMAGHATAAHGPSLDDDDEDIIALMLAMHQ